MMLSETIQRLYILQNAELAQDYANGNKTYPVSSVERRASTLENIFRSVAQQLMAQVFAKPWNRCS